MNRLSIIFSILIIVFLLTSILYAQGDPTWRKTLLVELRPHLTDNQVKQIAKRYGCRAGHIYRFDYDNEPHIAVKFFIKDEDKTPLQVLFDMEEDPRIISVNLDMPGKFFITADEVREKVWEENSYMLEALRWFDTKDYFNDKYDGEVNTLIIELDTGVAYEKYPWMREYLARLGYDRKEDRYYLPDDPDIGGVLGWDVTKGDNPDNVWPGPLDDEEVEFRRRHGTIGAQIMGVLSSGSRIVPIRIGKSSDWGTTYSNMKLGLKMALSSIEDIEELTGKNYNVVVNISGGVWLDRALKRQLRQDWIGEDGQGVEYAEHRIFPMFKDDCINREQWRDKIVEQTDYEPEDIEYQDLLENEDLLDIGIEWLFHAIYVEGTLSDKLKPTEDRGLWGELSTMKEKGWVILAGAGNLNFNDEKAYPAAREEVEGIDGVCVEENCAYCSLLHGDWTELAAPDSFSVYKDEGEFFNLGGTSVSTFITSALYAQIWDIAPNLDNTEINKIVKQTANVIKAGTTIELEKKLIHPYRAIRVANVYGQIKELLSYQLENQVSIDTQNILQALDDIDKGKDFTEIGDEIIEIFVETLEPENLESAQEEILNKLINHSVKIVPDIATEYTPAADQQQTQTEHESVSYFSFDSFGETQSQGRFSPILNNSNLSGNSSFSFSPTTSW